MPALTHHSYHIPPPCALALSQELLASLDPRDEATRQYCVEHLDEVARTMFTMQEAELQKALGKLSKLLERMKGENEDRDAQSRLSINEVRDQTRALIREAEQKGESRWNSTKQGLQVLGHKLEATDALNRVLQVS